jgi:DNA invertase Pin-like site-specific DNA recombinase
MTTANLLIAAAQYLRMSTEHQQYSLENQSAAIQKYAEAHGFEVVMTYSDAAKRGVVIKHRTSLLQLLKDVVEGAAPYKAVLVYDVSRWGRFQDIDEAAHYEFVCKLAGVPVIYCAETFSNDGTMPNLIMKALKRTMAGEYSRELGVKVLAGQIRLAKLGFKQGGCAGYGLRRMLVSNAGIHKQTLAFGERKSLATDRVILVAGPAEEVGTVRRIYEMCVSNRMSVCAIAAELNRSGVPYSGNGKWDYYRVHSILSHPKYAGCHVFNRTSTKLFTPRVELDRSNWVVTPGAFPAIVDPAVFGRAQEVLQDSTVNQSDEELLRRLSLLLGQEGRLSIKLIERSLLTPSASTYRFRFGSMRRAYELIGYGRPDQFGPLDLRRRTQALREELVDRIAAMFPADLSIVRRGGRWRSRLRMRNGLMISVVIARCVQISEATRRWQIDPNPHEGRLVTLLARLDDANTSFIDFHVLPNLDRRRRSRISLDDPWLKRGQPISDFVAFCDVVKRVTKGKNGVALLTSFLG